MKETQLSLDFTDCDNIHNIEVRSISIKPEIEALPIKNSSVIDHIMHTLFNDKKVEFYNGNYTINNKIEEVNLEINDDGVIDFDAMKIQDEITEKENVSISKKFKDGAF